MEKLDNCLFCGKKLSGRIDKKFCDHFCRSSYNNKIKREDEIYIQKINSILRRNRKILKYFNKEGKTTIRTEFLIKMGFNFKHYTHTYVTQNKITYKFCYEHGYTQIDKTKTLLITEQNYMK